MKKLFRYLFFLSLPVLAATGIIYYYQSLPIRGAFETRPVSYPTINKEQLKTMLQGYSQQELFQMYAAGLEAVKWQDLLGKVNATVISDVVKNFDEFFIGERYPHDESVDRETKCSYFYHSHRPKEHGHFHIYYSNKSVMKKYEPIATWDKKHPNTHLVAISMHPNGDPIGFFIPNHWITKDDWYRHEDMKEMVSHFRINHPYPSWPSNQWVSEMLKLFKPQVEHLLKERDEILFNSDKPLEKILRNRRQDVIASISISIPDQMAVLEEMLGKQLPDQSTE